MSYRVRRGTWLEAASVEARMPSDVRCLHEVPPPDAVWWVAVDGGGEPVAYAGMRPAHNHAGCLYSFGCAVLPEHRGHGLQVRLLRARQRYARRAAADIVTYTVVCNVPSARSLVRAGFVPWEPSVAWAGWDVCYWRWGHTRP